MDTYDLLPDEDVVIRVGPENGPFLVPNSRDDVTPEVFQETYQVYFNLSTDDKDQIPARMSVFDCKRTKVEEAKNIVGYPNASTVKLLVADIRALDEPGLDKLEVIEDPMPPEHPRSQYGGADGHCAVLGMNQGGKNDRRRLRFALVDVCKYIYSETECYS